MVYAQTKKQYFLYTYWFILLVTLSSNLLYELSMIALPLSLFWYMSSIFSLTSFSVTVFDRFNADRTAFLPTYTKRTKNLLGF